MARIIAATAEAAEQLQAAREALASAHADAAYWRKQYWTSVEAVRAWVEAEHADASDSAPRYRLLQQTLQDTRYGLDYAVRCASDARQELSSARQFYLDLLATKAPAAAASDMGKAALDSEEATSTSAPVTASTPPLDRSPGRDRSPEAGAVPFRIRTHAVTHSLPMQPACVPTSTLERENGGIPEPLPPPPTAAAPVATVVQEVPRNAGQVVGAGERSVSVSPSQPRPATGVRRISPLKRGGGETVYVVPPKRAKYARAFKWDNNMMHHFPKDFTIPVCTLATMWAYWVCGDPIAKYPPFRILIAPELEDAKTKRTLSSLRFVMLEIESRVLANGSWVNSPTAEDAAKMLETVKDSIAARPPAKRGELQPVEQLQWTSLGRIIRDQKKMMNEDEEDDYEDE
ncbi:Shikimate O-hydroxycinnamoyltransferase [Phytophthora cinnamomi]|uniref:Shikimate O-hydroxycinnamoyltransferase n=1 Tax=Phytophthora cinnamomi TaxID=4785 RepID=UPI003559BAC7|nr:Shikimate O-hydroxycinnamoyltransferase [Phytophthora cinnamomi]